MPHYNWYDLTPYEKAALLGSRDFPTYAGVGSPIDNGHLGSSGDSYLDTQNDILYFCIDANQWIASGGGNGQSIPVPVAGTECLHAYIVRSMDEGEQYYPPAADWNIQEQIGSALSVASDGSFVTSDEGTFSIFTSFELNWSVPFVIDDTFRGPTVKIGVNKPNAVGVTIESKPDMRNVNFFEGLAMDSRQGPPVHYIPNDTPSTIISSAILQVFAPTPYPAEQSVQLAWHIYITNQ